MPAAIVRSFANYVLLICCFVPTIVNHESCVQEVIFVDKPLDLLDSHVISLVVQEANLDVL